MDQRVRRRDGNPRTWLRTIIGLVAAAAILCGLTGCGVFASGGSTENAAERVVKDIDDAEVRVPDNPSRVVALSEPTLDAALALGVTPVGTVSGRGQNSVPGYLADKAKDIPLVGGIGDLDYEKISSLEPDLIIVDGTSVNNRPDVLEILRQIAPLVFCGYAGGPWELNFDTTARALNLEAKGEEVKSAFRDKVSKGRAQLAPTYGDKTFSIVRWQGSGPSLILKELPAGQVLEGARSEAAAIPGPRGERAFGPGLLGEPFDHRRGLHVLRNARWRKPGEPAFGLYVRSRGCGSGA